MKLLRDQKDETWIMKYYDPDALRGQPPAVLEQAATALLQDEGEKVNTHGNLVGAKIADAAVCLVAALVWWT